MRSCRLWTRSLAYNEYFAFKHKGNANTAVADGTYSLVVNNTTNIVRNTVMDEFPQRYESKFGLAHEE